MGFGFDQCGITRCCGHGFSTGSAWRSQPGRPNRTPGTRSKVEEAAKKKGKPSMYGTVTKPGYFAMVEQTSAWIFPHTGAAWGTEAARDSTFVGCGVSGNIKGSKDNLLSSSAQPGRQFVHEYSVLGPDQTPLRMDVSAFLSPLKGDDLSIYMIWRGWD